MARVLIVSRTRMANGYVCVGGVDIDNRLSLRLLSQNGGHESASECPYEIWDIWDIDYYLSHRRPNPHTEDANVTRREKTKNVDPQNISVEKLASALEKYNIPIFHGSLFSLFDGKLKLNDSDKLYISKDDVPDYSTCFWINDKRLLGYESRGHQKYRYNNMTNQYGYTISYVGEAEPLDTIEVGSLIRLSLAHWWSPEDSDDEERCYLQLSGCLIEAPKFTDVSAELSNNEENIEIKSFTPIPAKEALKGLHCRLSSQNDCYADSYIPIVQVTLSSPFCGQDRLVLSLQTAEKILQHKDKDAIISFLSRCLVDYNKESGVFEIVPPPETVAELSFDGNTADSQQTNDDTVRALSHMYKERLSHPQAYKPWSEDDDNKLKELFFAGKTIEELMELFQRNRGGIRSRLRKLGLIE